MYDGWYPVLGAIYYEKYSRYWRRNLFTRPQSFSSRRTRVWIKRKENNTPQIPQEQLEPVLEHILMSNERGFDGVNKNLEHLLVQGEQNNPEKILENQIIGLKRIEDAVTQNKTTINFETDGAEITTIEGPKGDKGDKGEKGDKGDQGEKGDKGCLYTNTGASANGLYQNIGTSTSCQFVLISTGASQLLLYSETITFVSNSATLTFVPLIVQSMWVNAFNSTTTGNFVVIPNTVGGSLLLPRQATVSFTNGIVTTRSADSVSQAFVTYLY